MLFRDLLEMYLSPQCDNIPKAWELEDPKPEEPEVLWEKEETEEQELEELEEWEETEVPMPLHLRFLIWRRSCFPLRYLHHFILSKVPCHGLRWRYLMPWSRLIRTLQCWAVPGCASTTWGCVLLSANALSASLPIDWWISMRRICDYAKGASEN